MFLSFTNVNNEIVKLNKQISTIIKELNPSTLSISGIDVVFRISIISEFGNIFKFSNPSKVLSFSSYEPEPQNINYAFKKQND